jgi:beta-glucosidase
VSNTGTRAGSDVAQVYAAGQLPDGRTIHHLVGWSKVFLQPGQTENVTVHVDLRTLASFDLRQVNWRVASGEYKIVVGRFSGDVQLRGQAMLAEQRLPP